MCYKPNHSILGVVTEAHPGCRCLCLVTVVADAGHNMQIDEDHYVSLSLLLLFLKSRPFLQYFNFWFVIYY